MFIYNSKWPCTCIRIFNFNSWSKNTCLIETATKHQVSDPRKFEWLLNNALKSRYLEHRQELNKNRYSWQNIPSQNTKLKQLLKPSYYHCRYLIFLSAYACPVKATRTRKNLIEDGIFSKEIITEQIPAIKTVQTQLHALCHSEYLNKMQSRCMKILLRCSCIHKQLVQTSEQNFVRVLCSTCFYNMRYQSWLLNLLQK